MSNFIAIAKHNNLKVGLITMPLAANDSYSEEEMRDIAGNAYREHKFLSKVVDQHNQLSRDLAKQNSLILIDLASSEINGKAEYFTDLCHLTEEGAELMANFVADKIAKLYSNNFR